MSILTVLRWAVPVDDGWHTYVLPGGFKPVLVAAREPGLVEFWQVAPADPAAYVFHYRPEPVDLLVLGTGHAAPRGARHVGSCLTEVQTHDVDGWTGGHRHLPAGALCWHLWTRDTEPDRAPVQMHTTTASGNTGTSTSSSSVRIGSLPGAPSLGRSLPGLAPRVPR